MVYYNSNLLVIFRYLQTLKSPTHSHDTCPSCGRQTASRSKCVYCSTVTDLDVKSLQFENFKACDDENAQSEFPENMRLLNPKTNTEFQINIKKVKIGRDASNQVVISDDTFTSRYHAWITFESGKFWLEDLSSTNGTFLNGHPLLKRQEIKAGDKIRVGHTELSLIQKNEN